MTLPTGNNDYELIGPGSREKVMDTLNDWFKADIVRGVVSHCTDGEKLSILARINTNKARNHVS